MKKKIICKQFIVLLLICFGLTASLQAQTPIDEKVAVLITAWGQPTRYVFEYSWNNHYWARVGETTEYLGEPCKIGHVGGFDEASGESQLSHLGIMPWGLNHEWPGLEYTYDRGGYYYLNETTSQYVSIHPDSPAIDVSAVDLNQVSVTPASEVVDFMTGALQFQADPRTGEDLMAGWYKIETLDYNNVWTNGLGDMYELNNMMFIHYYKIMGMPTEPWTAAEADEVHLFYEDKMAATISQLETAFGDQVDVRPGYYTAVPGYTEHEKDVAKDFAIEGFRKMLASRETTDNNHYANSFITGNYIKEALCEVGTLDETEFLQVRQIGRTPEYNAMNVMHVKPYIEAHPEGSTIAMIYVTHGLSWPGKETYGFMGVQHPWWKEVIHENSFLNYLSWKKALQEAYGDRYTLVFSRNDSNLQLDSFYAYGYMTTDKLSGKFLIIRDAIQMAKAEGIDKMVIVPAHWHGDAQDTQYIMRKNSHLPLVPKANMQAGQFDLTFCEDSADNETECSSPDTAAEITITPSYNDLTDEFASVYAVRLRGGIERFNVYPLGELFEGTKSQALTKRDGGTLEITDAASAVKGSKIIIPADPYPDYPEQFTPETAIAFNDPTDTFECMWEDNVFNIAHRTNPPAMAAATATAIGPAVHFGPYRTIFNRDVTITIPYNAGITQNQLVSPYIYNHLTESWDKLQADSYNNGLLSFKTQVLGLFQAGIDGTMPPDTISGTVTGDIQAGVTIEIYTPNCGGDILVGSTTTNSEGYYSFGDLEDGRYLLFASAIGYSFVPVAGWVDIPQTVIQPYNFTATVDAEINLWNKHLITDNFSGADMFTGDIDGDGKDEFVVIDIWNLKISWYDHELIDGEDNWTETVIDQAENLEFLPADHELQDMDGDGDLDVILAGMCTAGSVGFTSRLCEESQMLWYENVDQGATWEKHVIGDLQAFGANYIAVSDMDGDGDLDVATGTTWLPGENEYDEVAWFRNKMDEDGSWEKITISAPGSSGIKYANGIYISDLDNDGYPDVTVATSKGVEEVGTVYWFKSPGDTGADWQRFQVDPGMETASWSVFAIDVNNDGFNDLAVGRNDSRISSNPGGIIFYINPKNPENGGTWKQYSFVEGDYKMGPYFNFDDMDGDGELDIVNTYTGETTGDPGNVSWIKFHFDPIFGLIQDRRVMIATEHLKAWDVHTIDVLGNGKNGVVVSDFIIGNINWYEEP